MEIRILGRDLEVSEIGFGCMGMSHAYGTVSTQKEAEELIEKAIDEGCTFFDTAEIYGTRDCGGVVQFYAGITGIFIMQKAEADRFLSALQDVDTIRKKEKKQ